MVVKVATMYSTSDFKNSLIPSAAEKLKGISDRLTGLERADFYLVSKPTQNTFCQRHIRRYGVAYS